MTDTITLNTDYVGLDLTVAEPNVVTIACDTITLTREEAESMVYIMGIAQPCLKHFLGNGYALEKLDGGIAILNSKLKE